MKNAPPNTPGVFALYTTRIGSLKNARKESIPNTPRVQVGAILGLLPIHLVYTLKDYQAVGGFCSVLLRLQRL